jgi:hypothetical protein
MVKASIPTGHVFFQDLGDFVFLRYTVASWVAHTKQCDYEVSPEDLLGILAWPSNTLVDLWIRLYRHFEPYKVSEYWPPTGPTMEHIAAKHGMPRLLSHILHYVTQDPENVNVQDVMGRTPLSWTAEEGHKAVAQLLIEEGAEVDSKDAYDLTPLSWAAEGGYKDVVQLLVDKVARVNNRDSSGLTPLSLAAGNGHDDVIRLLIENGATIEILDHQGRSLLSRAAGNGNEGVVRLLIEKEAQIDSTNGYNRTPLSCRRKRSYEYS